MNGFVASFAETLPGRGFGTRIRAVSWATTTPPTSRSTTTSPGTSPSAIAGSARFPARPGPTASTRFPAAPRAAAMTCRTTSRRCTTSRRSYATSTPTASPGAGTPSRSAPCVWPTPATPSDTTTTSRSSAGSLTGRPRLSQDRQPGGELPRGRGPGHAPVGLLDRPELQRLQPLRLPAQRRPRAGGHQRRPGTRTRGLPRAGHRPAVGQDDPGHLLRRAWRLLRSRPAPRRGRR